MQPVNYRISLDVYKMASQQFICVKQGDTNRRLFITLMENGQPYQITDDCRAEFSLIKSNGLVACNDCIIQDNTVIYNLTAQNTLNAGECDCEIILYGSDDAVLTSPRFKMIVYETVFTEGDVESPDGYMSLHSLIIQANALVKDITLKLDQGEFVGEKGDAPLLKGEDNKLYVSYDGGLTWNYLQEIEFNDVTEDDAGKILEVNEQGKWVASNSLNEIKKTLSDLTYKKIEITDFSNDIKTVEKGSTVTDVVLSWKFNKIPTRVTLKEVEKEVEKAVDSKGETLTGLSIKTNKTWTLIATDDKGNTASKQTSISFLNGVYYGIAKAPATYDRAFILGLTKELRSDKKPSFTVNAGAGQYIYYCLPISMGTCTFTVGVLSGGFELVDTISFLNATQNHTESYYIYKSNNANLGNKTVNVT